MQNLNFLDTTTLITISILFIVVIATFIFCIAMIKSVRKISIQQLEHASKLIRDIDKLKMSLQDEICNIEKIGDALKMYSNLMRDFQKHVTTMITNLNSLSRNVESVRAIGSELNRYKFQINSNKKGQ